MAQAKDADQAPRARRAYGSWAREVERQGKETGYVERAGKWLSGACYFIAMLFTGACILSVGIVWTRVPTALKVVVVAVAVVCTASMWLMGRFALRRSREGTEVQAKCKALKHWFEDFTRLDEALPTDVLVWKHFLVLACALGVANVVVKGLREVLPQVLDSQEFSGSYGWAYSGAGTRGSGNFDAQGISSFTSSVSGIVAPKSSGGGGGGGSSSGSGGGGGGGGGVGAG